jgi:hypothetical protein
VKKYLVVLIPFVACSIFAYIYGLMEPAEYPHPTYPYRTPEIMDYLSNTWFVIGLVLSVLLFLLLIIEDVFSLISKKLDKRKQED